MASWKDLSPRLRERVLMRLGEVFSVEQPPRGSGSDIAAILWTASGPAFLKAIRLRGARVEIWRIEQKVQSYLPDLAPRLLWQTETDGWLLMVFEYVAGRHASLAPGSSDLPLIAGVLQELSQHCRSDLPVLPIEKRWAPLAGGLSLASLRGTTVVHTDLTAENILISDRVRVVDWAWPTRGAAWLDTAFMVTRLIQAGHTPAAAEMWARTIPAWGAATDDAIMSFITVRAAHVRAHAHDSLSAALSVWKEYRYKM